MSRLQTKALLLVAALAAAIPFTLTPHHQTPRSSAGVVQLAANLEPHPELRASRIAKPGGGSPPRAVVVRSGDSLTKIAAGVGTTWIDLAAFNHLADPNMILPGQRLAIPPSGWKAPPGYRPAPPAQPVYARSTPVYARTAAPAISSGDVWGCIAGLESTGVRYQINPAVNTGNGYYGAFQFLLSTWRNIGGPPGLPSDYPYATQLAMAEKLQAAAGWGQWPVTSGECGV